MRPRHICLIILTALVTTPATCAQPYEEAYDDPLAIKGEVRCNIAQDQLTEAELQRLAAHDIVILIDKSGSMNTCDCPKVKEGSSKGSKLLQTILLPALLCSGYLSTPLVRSSRWDWCAEQTIKMATQAGTALPDGFTVVTFADGFTIHKNMTVDTLPQLFTSGVPFGGTHLAPPLNEICKNYFQSRTLESQHVKPLSIGIITDGIPLDKFFVSRAIASAVKQLTYANEINIVFFLIGENDFQGKIYISYLMHKFSGKKFQFHIVKAVSFKQLKQAGLARCLAMNLQ